MFRMNIILFVLELVGTIWMMSGFDEKRDGVLTDSKLNCFRFFTVDSNVLMGIIALIAVIMQAKNEKLPDWYYTMKLTGTVGVTLTMLVTICFLAPTFGEKWHELFKGSNFFFHLLNPLISIIIFLGFESGRITFSSTLVSLLPVALYALFYLINVVVHIEDGKVSKKYDWYGFLFKGIKTIPLVIIIVLGCAWVISLILWRLSSFL